MYQSSSGVVELCPKAEVVLLQKQREQQAMGRENVIFLSASSCALPSSPVGRLCTLNQQAEQAEKHTGNKKGVCISKGSE